MFKNKLAEIKVPIHYVDVNHTVYEGIAFVIINSSYEIQSVRFEDMKSWDKFDDPIPPDFSRLIKEQLETIAGAKALEKIQSVDFEVEDEKE